jgi:DNA invertase Pin-like site-specific DNA recombinase
MDEKTLKAPSASPRAGDSGTASTARCEQRLPRAKKERRRNKSERGLAPDRELRQLAADFLTTQRRLWPGLADTALIPPSSDEVIVCLVEDFKARHRQGTIEPLPKSDESKHPQRLGGFYGRYSCDNSNPKSIADQRVKVLEQAKKCDRFVPWAYVFADCSSSGLSPARQGYTSYKAVLQDPKHRIDTTFIDDFTRASRDEVEWWRLAHLSRRMNKQMIGASDGFDLSNPNSEIMITVFGLVSRLLVKGIREKVRRGMHGAARRGGGLGKPPLGFTRTPRLDESGQVVRDPNGLPQYVYAVDPEAAEFRRLMYELFVVQGLSFYKIAKRFNELKIDEWSGWNESCIKKILWSASAVGVFIWTSTGTSTTTNGTVWFVSPIRAGIGLSNTTQLLRSFRSTFGSRHESGSRPCGVQARSRGGSRAETRSAPRRSSAGRCIAATAARNRR